VDPLLVAYGRAVASPNDLSRRAYDDFASHREMTADCREVGRNLRLPRLERAAQAALTPPPSIEFDDYPREVAKRDIRISDAAARLANALHLHLD
jgi:hypothetical protein